MKIKLDRFLGMAPKFAPRELPTEFSAFAKNCKLWSKELSGVRKPLRLLTPTKTGTIQSIYPLADIWLHWTQDVDVAQGTVANDAHGRIYYTGHTTPKVTNETLAKNGVGNDYPLDFYQMGMPASRTAPTVAPDASGSGAADSRSYVYTYVTQWGEESGPSTASALTTGLIDDVWNISAILANPPNSGGINSAVHASGVVTVTTADDHHLRINEPITISGVVGMTDLNGAFTVLAALTSTTFTVTLTTAQAYVADPGDQWVRETDVNIASLTKRIYRTVSGTFKFVAEINAAATSYADTKADLDLGEEIPSTDWEMPPANMIGLIALPNGIMAGFTGNELAFSEPNQPHAWPANYRLTTDWDIVAIGAYGNQIVVGTEGQPYSAHGIHPASMAMDRIELKHACISKRSMLSVRKGVYYASPEGIVRVSSGGAALFTDALFSKDEWAVYNPASMMAQRYDDRYYGFYTNGGENSDESGHIVLDPDEPEAALVLGDDLAAGGYSDIKTDDMYLLIGGDITQWEKGGEESQAGWKSKTFIFARPLVMSAAQIHHTTVSGASIAEINAAIAAGMLGIDGTRLPSGVAGEQLPSSGAFAGYTPATWPVAGGPYANVVNELGALPPGLTFKLIGNGVVVHVEDVQDNRPFRIAGGERYDTVEIELSANKVRVHDCTVAENLNELGRGSG